jgi:hypothetical protein
MSWFGKKKEKKPADSVLETKPETKPETKSDDVVISLKTKFKGKLDDIPDKIDFDISGKRLDTYTTPGVDEAIYSRERVKKEFLCRPTLYTCPDCNSTLYDVKLDATYYYCPKCNVNHHKKNCKVEGK